MNDAHIAAIVTESGLSPAQVSATAALLAEGATVPFVARYRKEATGSLDEIQITLVRDRLHALAALDARREAVLKSLEQHGHLTAELKTKIDAAASLSELEDLYLPYRPKRRTAGADPLRAKRVLTGQGGRRLRGPGKRRDRQSRGPRRRPGHHG